LRGELHVKSLAPVAMLVAGCRKEWLDPRLNMPRGHIIPRGLGTVLLRDDKEH
jgi:hypothetical protein